MGYKRFSSEFVKRYKLTTLMYAIGLLYFLAVHVFGLDLFEWLIEQLQNLLIIVEPYEGDEVIPVLLLISVGVFADALRQRRHAREAQKLSRQRLEVMRVTMSNVHDVVNNFLNNMQLFRFEAERCDALDAKQLAQFDDLIAQTALKLKEIEKPPEFKGQANSLYD